MTPYESALHALGVAGASGLTLENDGTYEILYLTAGYTVNLDTHDFEDDLGANISHRETITTTWAGRVFDASDIAVTDPNNGQTVTQIVIVKSGNGTNGVGGGGTAGTNRLICHQALASSVTWDGTNDSQTFNASGIFRIGAA